MSGDVALSERDLEQVLARVLKAVDFEEARREY